MRRPRFAPSQAGDEIAGPTSAGVVAESSINDRLKDFPAAYRPYERAASDACGGASIQRLRTHARDLCDISEFQVLPQAMLAAADILETAGKYRFAAQVLNQVYRKYRDLPDKPARYRNAGEKRPCAARRRRHRDRTIERRRETARSNTAHAFTQIAGWQHDRKCQLRRRCRITAEVFRSSGNGDAAGVQHSRVNRTREKAQVVC